MKLQKALHALMGSAVLLAPGIALAGTQTRVSEADARRAALAAVPGEVLESELENEDGRLVFVFEIRRAMADGSTGVEEVLVDPETGSVLAVENEAGEEDDEEAGKADREDDEESEEGEGESER